MRSCSLCLLSCEILNLLGDSPAGASHSLSLADSLLRFKPLSTERRLDPTGFSHLLRLLQTLSVDLFKLKLLRFLSQFPDESAVGVEALSQPWEFLGMMYLYSPTPLLTVVLGRI